jgi:hypothetical protein
MICSPNVGPLHARCKTNSRIKLNANHEEVWTVTERLSCFLPRLAKGCVGGHFIPTKEAAQASNPYLMKMIRAWNVSFCL